MRALWLTVTFIALGAVFSAPAFGTFRGRDGLLVLQPLAGPGLVLVGSHGGNVHRICTDASVCGTPVAPRWSPNGREIVFADGHSSRLEITAAQGTCLWCLSGPPLSPVGGSEASFTAGGTAITFVGHPNTPSQGVWKLGVGDAQPQRTSIAPVADVVTSSTGQLAVTRAGYVWVGSIVKLKRLARGGSPSWSPSGDELALARAGSVYVVRVHGGASAQRRIARGFAPAFSPDGRSVAYIGAGHRVYVVGATGGRARRVRGVQARTIDWQPLPGSVVTSCASANGHVVASDGQETIRAAASASTAHIGWNGCLTALGVPWHLAGGSLGDGYNTDLTETALAAPFAALHFYNSDKYMMDSDTLNVYDLRDGKLISSNANPCLGQNCSINSIQLNSRGFTAWHASEPVSSIPLAGVSCPTASLCVAVDALGSVLTATNPTGGAGAWTRADVDGVNGLTGVSCPTTTLCVAVDGLGNIVTSTNPTGGPGAWTVAHVGTSLTAVTCASEALCVAVGLGGQAFTTTDPTGGAGSWTAAEIDSGNTLSGVSCPSVGLCVAVDPGGRILSSVNPTGGAAAWASTEIAATPSPLAFAGVSCPSVSLCVAASNDSGGGGVFPGGRATVSTNPTGGASAWTTVIAGPAIFSPSSVACASVSLCVIGEQAGNLVTSTDPAGGQAAWPQALSPSMILPVAGSITGLSCPSAALCAAVTRTGDIATTTSPSALPVWTSAAVDVPHCGAYSLCEIEQIYAQDDQGIRVIDSVRSPGTGQVLANLQLSGDELTWTDNGLPRSATLG